MLPVARIVRDSKHSQDIFTYPAFLPRGGSKHCPCQGLALQDT